MDDSACEFAAIFCKRRNMTRKPITAAGESARDALCATRKFLARAALRRLEGQHTQERLRSRNEFHAGCAKYFTSLQRWQ
jgi:hypothetical protein